MKVARNLRREVPALPADFILVEMSRPAGLAGREPPVR
jgi:hypothetical protein